MRRITAIAGVLLAVAAGATAPADATSAPVAMTTAKAYDGSALQVGAVALSPGRVTWSDNSVKGGAIWTRVLTRTSTGFTAGPVHKLGTGMPKVMSADGLRTAWIAGGNVVVRSGFSTTVLPGAFATIKLSGLRLLATGPDQMVLFDLRTGGRTDLVSLLSADPQNGDLPRQPASPADLWGDDLVYTHSGGSVWTRNVATARNTQVAGPVSNYLDTSVYAAANHVGWMRRTEATNDTERCTAYESTIVHLGSGSAPQTDTDSRCDYEMTYANSWLSGLNVDGAVTSWDNDLPASGRILAPWDGSSHINLTEASYYEDMITLDVDGPYEVQATWPTAAPRVSLLPHPVAVRPQSLGNVVAPATATRGGSWQVIDVVSAVPHTCAVDIRNAAGTVVRSLGCMAAWQQGEIRAVWDGKTSTGAYVAPGTYRWTIRAANSSGSLLNSDATTAPITGTIALS